MASENTNNSQQRPNILIILSDQLRRQALSCYGDPDSLTPNMDKISREGVRFSNACSTYPICVPFRFTLMTGEYAHTRLIPGIEWAMSPAERTLADELNDIGYDTIYVGKWHLDGGCGRMGSPKQCGMTPVRRNSRGRWKRWYGFELRNDPLDTYYFIDDDPEPHALGKYQTDGLFDLGIDYLARKWDHSTNFCMCISVEPPHPPFVAPADLQKKWESSDISLPGNFKAGTEEERERFIMDRKRYYSMVENLDINVGRMIDFLKGQGIYENTVVLVFSDHGELNGSHGLAEKQWPYEESIGIPLIIHDPASTDRKGKVLEDPVCTEDLFPTILGFAGTSPRNNVPGLNLVPLIRGETTRLGREGVFLEFVSEHRPIFEFHKDTWRGVRTRRFKYTVRGDKNGGRPWQFFDLDKDPCEMENLLENPVYRDEIIRHHAMLAGIIRGSEDPFVLFPAYGEDGCNCWSKEPR